MSGMCLGGQEAPSIPSLCVLLETVEVGVRVGGGIGRGVFWHSHYAQHNTQSTQVVLLLCFTAQAHSPRVNGDGEGGTAITGVETAPLPSTV